MKIVPDKTTVVIAGAFNPAILTPAWVGTNLLGLDPAQDFLVEIISPIGGGEPSRLSFEGLTYTASSQRVMFHLSGDDDLIRKAMDAAAKLLLLLPHTPIVGVGFNFGFVSADPTAKALSHFVPNQELAAALSDEADIVKKAWGQTTSWGETLVTTAATLGGDGLTFDVNFHLAIESTHTASAMLAEPNSFSLRREKALVIATSFDELPPGENDD